MKKFYYTFYLICSVQTSSNNMYNDQNQIINTYISNYQFIYKYSLIQNFPISSWIYFSSPEVYLEIHIALIFRPLSLLLQCLKSTYKQRHWDYIEPNWYYQSDAALYMVWSPYLHQEWFLKSKAKTNKILWRCPISYTFAY